MKKLLSLAAVLLAAVTINAQEPISMTCAEAAQAALSVSKNNELYNNGALYSVQGFVTEIAYEWASGSMSFWMADEANGGRVLEAYKCAIANKEDAVRIGDQVKVTGKLTKYNTTPEFAQGCTVEMIKRAEVLPVDTITVSQALQRIKDGKLQPCAVKGKVIEPFINTKAGNAVCYWMADVENPNDSIQAFKMNGADDQKYSSLSDLEFLAGDVILVYAKALANYHDNGKDVDIPEINGGYYIRTISSDKPSEKLDWTDGLAVFFEDHWQLEISKGDKNVLLLQFSSDKETTIGGHHDLAPGSTIKVNGSEVDITSGFVKLTFKELSTEGYNVYTTQVSAITDEKVYVIANDLEFMAVRDDYETEIDLVDDRPFQPTEDNQEVTCEQARSYTLSLADKQTSEWRLVVHGFVTDLFTDGESFWMADTKNGGKVIEAYKFSSLAPATKALAKGAEVIVTGKVQNYGGTPEIKNGKVQIISGGVDVETSPVSVAEALTIAKALTSGQTTSIVYSISGFIASEAEYNEKYDNYTFTMSDKEQDEDAEFIAYRVSCEASLAELLVPGTKVTVVAKLTHYHQDAKPATDTEEAKPERDLYETAEGGVVVLYATGVENITIDANISKFIYEGQLYIINGNVIYNVQGQRVK